MRVLQREGEELCADYIETPQEMEFSEDDEVHFECAQVCHICQQIILDDNDRVRDHCHFTGVYRGVAHNACNLNYRISQKSWKLPVVIHNLKGYDGHLIVKSVKSEFGQVRVIPQNMEKYLSISVGRLKFLVSLQFTPQSLDVLSKTLEDDEFKYLSESCIGDGFIPMIIWIASSFEIELPPQSAFFNNYLEIRALL